MHHPLDGKALNEIQEGFDIDSCGTEKLFAEAMLQAAHPVFQFQPGLLQEHLAGQRETIAVETLRSETDDPVPHAYFGTVYQFVGFDYSYAKSREVILAFPV
jgi:hypothetical protein